MLEYQGPQSALDRDTPLENYVADQRLIRCYDYRTFLFFLTRANNGETLLPHNACERVFMEALVNTSKSVERRSEFRGVDKEVNSFRGPQCLPHRDNVQRLHFRPGRAVTAQGTRGQVGLSRVPPR